MLKKKQTNFLPISLPEPNRFMVSEIIIKEMTTQERIDIASNFLSKHKFNFNWVPLGLSKSAKFLFIYQKLIDQKLGAVKILDSTFNEVGELVAPGIVHAITIDKRSSTTNKLFIFTWIDTDKRFKAETDKKNLCENIKDNLNV